MSDSYYNKRTKSIATNGNNDTTSTATAVGPTTTDTIGNTPFIKLMGDSRRPRSLYNQGDDGLDWVRKDSNDLQSNAIVSSGTISMLGSDGEMHVVDTYTAGQWESKNREDRRYDGRYDRPSGLNVKGRSSYKDNQE